MDSTKALVSSIQDELKDLTGAISNVMQTFKKMQEPIAESRQKVPEATKQLEKISEQTEEAAHQMIDKVESISRVSEEIVSDVSVLRKTLPATYFKNRSRIRDAVNAIDQKSKQNLDDAFKILNALQFQDITTQQIQHASTLLEEIEQRLHHILAVFDGKEDIEKLRSILTERAYDPNANFSDSRETQDDIDSLISSLKSES